jgi:hypothetical protein
LKRRVGGSLARTLSGGKVKAWSRCAGHAAPVTLRRSRCAGHAAPVTLRRSHCALEQLKISPPIKIAGDERRTITPSVDRVNTERSPIMHRTPHFLVGMQSYSIGDAVPLAQLIASGISSTPLLDQGYHQARCMFGGWSVGVRFTIGEHLVGDRGMIGACSAQFLDLCHRSTTDLMCSLFGRYSIGGTV